MPRKVVIVGAGNGGEQAIINLSANEQVVSVADNDPAKRHTFFCGHKVITPDELSHVGYDVIRVASMYWEEIVDQLTGLGHAATAIEIFPIKEHVLLTGSNPDDVRQCLRQLQYAISDYKQNQGNFPAFMLEKKAPELPHQILSEVTVYPHRRYLLEMLPANAVVAELGTDQGHWAIQILKKLAPSELHLFDLGFEVLRRDVANHQSVVLHQGDSADNLKRMPDAYYDWIYIDGDHTYRGVSRDVEQAQQKVKPNGMLVFNDYTVWSSKSAIPYGVVAAVNELLLSGWEMTALCLNPTGYWDVAVRRKA